MLINCDNCGIEFNKKPSRIKASKFHYCSSKCNTDTIGERLKTGKIVNCAECGAPVYRNKSDLKSSKSGDYYCTKKCAEIGINKKRRGSNHPNWKGGATTYRTIALEKYGYKCNRCKYNIIKDILQVHHIDHNRQNNNISNLEVLCPNCHAIEHWSQE